MKRDENIIGGSLGSEMHRLYASGEDPWRYGRASKHDVTVEMVMERWDGGRFLEPACAEGALTAKLLKEFHSRGKGASFYRAFDLNKIALERCGGRIASLKASGSLGCDAFHCTQEDIRELNAGSFKDEFDFVLASDFLEYQPSIGATLRMLKSWVKVGGFMLVSLWRVEYCSQILYIDGLVPIKEKFWSGKAVHGERESEATGYYMMFTRTK